MPDAVFTTDEFRVCLQCRTGLGPAEACRLHPLGEPADVCTPEGREALRTRVWGSPSLRSKLRGAASVDPAADGVLAGLFGLVFPQAPGEVLLPRGGLPDGAGPAGARPRPMAGTVSHAEGELDAPFRGERCVAWGVTLTRNTYAGAGPVLLRDGACVPFELTLDDRRVVWVLAGRCTLDGRGRRYPSHARTGSGFWVPVDPDDDAQDFPLFPAEAIEETLLRVGDRVLLSANLGGKEASYRERDRLVAAGPVSLSVSRDRPPTGRRGPRDGSGEPGRGSP